MDIISFQYTKDSAWINLEAAKKLDSSKSLILVFFSPSLANDPELFKYLHQSFPLSQIAGCSTAGEINQDHVKDDSITCTITKFEQSSFELKSILINDTLKSFSVAEKLTKSFSQQDLKGVFVLSDGLNVNGSELVKGIHSVIDSSKIVISGGLAADGSDFEKTHVLEDDQVQSHKMLMIAFYGEDLVITSGCRGGWDIFGPKRTVTKSQGNILYEIDHKPALELYKKYLGTHSKDLPASGLLFPLEISFNENDKKFVRTILSVDEELQSLTFAGDINEGANCQLMRANFERIIEGASSAAQNAKIADIEENANSLLVAISCVGRRLVLGARADEEIEALNDSNSDKTTILGFYSYGEIAAADDENSPCELHNQTMTLIKIHEKNQR